MVHRNEFLRDYRLEVATEFHLDGQDAQWASPKGAQFWGDEEKCIELDTSGTSKSGRSGSVLAVSSDSRLLAIAASSVVRVLDPKSQRLLTSLKGHPHDVGKLVFAPCVPADGEECSKSRYTLLSVSEDDRSHEKVIIFWNLDGNGSQVTSKPFTPFKTDDLSQTAVSAIASDLQQEHGVSADEIESFRSSLRTAIDIVEKQHRLKTLLSVSGNLPSHTSGKLFSFSKDGMRVLYLAKNQTTQHGMRPAYELPQIVIAAIRPTNPSNSDHNESDEQSLQTLKILQGHTDLILSVVFSPDGKRVASASWDQTFRIWSVETGECLHSIGPSGSQNWGVSFTPSGDHVLLSGGGRDKSSPLALHNTATGGEVSRLHYPEIDRRIRRAAIHPDGKCAAVINGISILLWDLTPVSNCPKGDDPSSNAIEIFKLANPYQEDPKSPLRMFVAFASFADVSWVDGGKKLLVRGGDSTIFVWDRERNVKWRFQRPDGLELPGFCSDFVYLDDGESGTIVALNGDRRVRFWKL